MANKPSGTEPVHYARKRVLLEELNKTAIEVLLAQERLTKAGHDVEAIEKALLGAIRNVRIALGFDPPSAVGRDV